MDKRIGVVGIIIESEDAVDAVNTTLHSYRDIIAGRMGLPYRERGCSVISLIVDADSDRISALTGTLGKITGVSVKSALQKNK
ncbi:MAG: CopG family transcriptional regulator [Ruminococcus sp.]|nr:CopG family transcriptional regulator [Ruminococcus sp.]